MKRTRWWVAATVIVVIGVAFFASVKNAGAQLGVGTTSRAGAAIPVGTALREYTKVEGVGIARSRVGTRKAWAVVLGNPPISVAFAGFKLPPASASGIRPQARLRATFNVLQVVGRGTQVLIEVGKSGAQTGNCASKQSGVLTGPGTVTLVSDMITMQPGVQYEGRAFVGALSIQSEDGINGGVVTVTELKWE